MRILEKDQRRLWLPRLTILAMLAIAVAWAQGSRAGDVYLHGLSYHYYNRHDGMNEVNAGLSYKWRDNEGTLWHVGAYHNTERQLSLFAMRPVEARHWGMTWGAGPGLVTGYEWPVTPVVGAYVEHGPLHLALFPGVAAISFRLTWPRH